MTEREICEKIINNGGCLRKAKQEKSSHEDILNTSWKINDALSIRLVHRNEPAETPPEDLEV